MTETQVKNLKLGIEPIDARTILLVESAFNWMNDNTTLVIDYNDDDTLATLTPNMKLFVIKYIDIMNLSAGVTSESIEGLSQSYDTSSKSNLLWQYANELLGNYMKSQMSFTCSKSRWKRWR